MNATLEGVTAVTYAVVAHTNAHQPVWCCMVDGRLVISYEPVTLEFGPVISDVYRAAMSDVHLFDVRIVPA